MKHRRLLFFILLFAALIRLFLLNSFPTGISNDELHFVLNAKSVFLQFTDLARSGWNPLSFQTIPQEASSELPFLLAAPFIGPLPLSLFWSKLFYVLISLTTIFLTYKITLILINPKIALISAAVFTLNPWSVYVGKTAFDAPIALCFFLLFIYLALILRGWKLLLSLFPALIGFYSYIGTKVIFIPLVLIVSYFSFHFRKKARILPYLVLVFGSLFIVIFYYLNIQKSSVLNRFSELISPNNPQILYQSQTDKNLSLRSPFKPIFSSPVAVLFRQSFSKYLNNFSPDVLFLTGDHTYLVSLWQHGYFYYLDALFLLLGLIYLFWKQRNVFLLLIGLILISPIPEAIRIDRIPAYAFHSVLQYPFLIILISAGIYFTLNSIPKLKYPLLFAYTILFLNFIDIYFFRYPIFQSEGFNFSRRLLSRYLSLESTKSPIISVLAKEPESLFRNYLFFNNQITRGNLNQISETYQHSQKRQHFVWENILITSNLADINPQGVVISDIDITDPKYLSSDKFSIARLSDPGKIFNIYRGITCSSTKLDPFTHNLNFTDFNLEFLPENQFCQKFIIKTFD